MDGPPVAPLWHNDGVMDLGGANMDKIVRIGMDTSKQVFQLHGVNAAEQPCLQRKLRRSELVAFFSGIEPTVIGIEASGAAHQV